MPTLDPRVDAYILAAPEFAQPILARVRRAFHVGCPKLEENIKWGAPSFEYQGLLGGMAHFKRHVAFGFWKSRLMADFEATFGRPGRASAMGAKVTALQDLPAQATLVRFVREAARLNREGLPEPKRAAKVPRPPLKLPADLAKDLAKAPRAREFFESLAPSHRREYLEWILEAKRPETRATRIASTLELLSQGKHRHWKYER